jgi:hypothetical protein
MIDDRKTDVAEAERLLEAARQGGVVPLPELIAVDLCALGAAWQSMFDEPVWRSWVALPDSLREELTADSRAGLVRRRLLDLPPSVESVDGTQAFRVAPALALIMAARAHPAFIALGSAAGGQRGAPRMYGIADMVCGLRAVLIEHASAERIGLGTGERLTLPPALDQQRAGDLHQLYQYLLVSPERAVQVLSKWLTTSPGDGRDADGGARTVDVFRHRQNADLTRDRLSVTASPSGPIRVVCAFAGDQLQSSPDYELKDITELLTQMLLVRTLP